MSGTADRLGDIDDLVVLADAIRRDFGATLPPASPRETHHHREARLERTKFELERQVMPRVNGARVAALRPALSTEQEDRVVEIVLSSMFLLPHLMGILEREPLAEDFVVFGNGPGRVDRNDGTSVEYPPLVATDEELERVIAKVAEDHHRPFSFESPTVDVQLTPRLRFHGQGFDIVSRPAIFLRVHRAMGATVEEIYDGGAMCAGLAYLLGTVASRARLSAAFSGVQGAGKTTTLRAVMLSYPPDTRMLTIETDFELGMVSLGRPWTQEMQARLPVTTRERGISPADLMRPALRTRADVIAVGEVRGDEGAPAIRAANVGQGTLVTVHGDSAEAGLEQLVDRVCDDGTPRDIARRMVYKSFDLVVQCAMSPDRRRWISEVVHPLMEGDHPKIHTLYGPPDHGEDGRARPTSTTWPPTLMQKIRMNYPAFDLHAAQDPTCRPLVGVGTERD